MQSTNQEISAAYRNVMIAIEGIPSDQFARRSHIRAIERRTRAIAEYDGSITEYYHQHKTLKGLRLPGFNHAVQTKDRIILEEIIESGPDEALREILSKQQEEMLHEALDRRGEKFRYKEEIAESE